MDSVGEILQIRTPHHTHMAQDHRSLIALRFTLTRTHKLEEGKHFTIKPKIGGGKVTMLVIFKSHDPADFKTSLEEVAKREKCELELDTAA